MRPSLLISCLRLLVTPLLFAAALLAQQHPIGGAPHRLIAVVPLQGAGTPLDPVRPLFVQTPEQIESLQAAGHAPIPLWHRMLITDDGKFAIVEFSSPSPLGLKPVRQSTDSRVTIYEAGSLPLLVLEQTLQKVRKDFNLGVFLGAPAGTKITAQAAAQ